MRPVPGRLVLGGQGSDAAVAALTAGLDDIRASETLPRNADFPTT